MDLRAKTGIAPGPEFDRLKFNDFVIGQGLPPPDLPDKAAEQGFIPSLQ
jgi:hypothetical protein